MRFRVLALMGFGLLIGMPAFSELDPPDEDTFVIQNDTEILAFIDDVGNFELLGFVFDHASAGDLATAGDDFIVRDSSDPPVNVARISADGNLFLAGDLSENENWCDTEDDPWLPSTGARVPGLIVRDSLETSVAWIDESGNMLLRGSMTENADATSGPAPGDNVRITISAPITVGVVSPADAFLTYTDEDPEVQLRLNRSDLGDTIVLPTDASDVVVFADFEWGRHDIGGDGPRFSNTIQVIYIAGETDIVSTDPNALCNSGCPKDNGLNFHIQIEALRDDTDLDMTINGTDFPEECGAEEIIDGTTFNNIFNDDEWGYRIDGIESNDPPSFLFMQLVDGGGACGARPRWSIDNAFNDCPE